MKLFFAVTLLFCAGKSNGQGNADLKRIDSVVTKINYTKSKPTLDSIFQSTQSLGCLLELT